MINIGVLEAVIRINDQFTKPLVAASNQLTGTGHAMSSIGRALVPISASLAASAVGAVMLAGKLEQTRIGFTTMLGSAEKATDFLQQLRDFAATTPFEFPELVSSAQRLMAMGFEAQKVIPMLTSVGDAVGALGGGGAMIGRVTLALGQMQAKGKVSGEEMRQLAESGIPAWDMLAKKIGVSVPEAMALSEKGAINVKDAIAGMIEGMNQRFGGMMKAQSQTLLGLLSTVKDEMRFMMTDLGTILMPSVKAIVDVLVKVTPVIKEVVHAFTLLPEPVKTAASALVLLTAAAGPVLWVGGQVIATAGSMAASIAAASETIALKLLYARDGVDAFLLKMKAVPGVANAATIALKGFAVVGVAVVAYEGARALTKLNDSLLGIERTTVDLNFMEALRELPSIIEDLGRKLSGRLGLDVFLKDSKEGWLLLGNVIGTVLRFFGGSLADSIVQATGFADSVEDAFRRVISAGEKLVTIVKTVHKAFTIQSLSDSVAKALWGGGDADAETAQWNADRLAKKSSGAFKSPIPDMGAAPKLSADTQKEILALTQETDKARLSSLGGLAKELALLDLENEAKKQAILTSEASIPDMAALVNATDKLTEAQRTAAVQAHAYAQAQARLSEEVSIQQARIALISDPWTRQVKAFELSIEAERKKIIMDRELSSAEESLALAAVAQRAALEEAAMRIENTSSRLEVWRQKTDEARQTVLQLSEDAAVAFSSINEASAQMAEEDAILEMMEGLKTGAPIIQEIMDKYREMGLRTVLTAQQQELLNKATSEFRDAGAGVVETLMRQAMSTGDAAAQAKYLQENQATLIADMIRLGMSADQAEEAIKALKEQLNAAAGSGSQFSKSLKDLPSTVLGALQGGGDVGKAVGASLGGGLGDDLVKPVTKALGFLGPGISSALGAAMPVVGTMLGSALGGVADKLVGAFKKPGWKEAMKEVGRDYGTTISEELGKAIEATGKELNIGRFEASLLHLGDIMGEGLAQGQSIKAFEEGITNLFNSIEMGVVPAKDGIASLGAVFEQVTGQISEGSTEALSTLNTMTTEVLQGISNGSIPASKGLEMLSGGWTALQDAAEKGSFQAEQGMLAMILQARAAGQEVAGMAEYVQAALDQASSGLTAAFTGFKQLTEADAGAQGVLFATTFWAQVKEGGLLGAVEAMKPAWDALQASFKESGFNADEILGPVRRMMGMVNEETKPMFDGILGLQNALTGLTDAGYMTEQAFSAFGQQAQGAFEQLTAAGVAPKDALMGMAPMLAEMQRTAGLYGMELDANAQKLIAQAESMGIAFPVEPQQVMIDLLSQIVVLMGGEIPASAQTMASAGTTALEGLTGAGSTAMAELGAAATASTMEVGSAFGKMQEEVSTSLTSVLEVTTGTLGNVTDAVAGSMDGMALAAEVGGDKLTEVMTQSFANVTKTGTEMVSSLHGQFATLSKGITVPVRIDMGGSTGGFNPGDISPYWSPSDIPHYASGGVVSQPQIAQVGEVPEAIIPLSELGRYTGGGNSNAVVAGLLQQILAQLSRSGGRGGDLVIDGQRLGSFVERSTNRGTIRVAETSVRKGY